MTDPTRGFALHPAGLSLVAAIMLSLAACGIPATAELRASTPGRAATATPRAAAASSAIDRLTATARHRYRLEAEGPVTKAKLRKVARDPGLQAALASGSTSRLRSYVRGRFQAVWYHWHVSRMRLMKGSHVLADAGVPFVVRASQKRLHGNGGKYLATLQVSIQDEIGFVRYMNHNYPVQVVVRGRGASHHRSSLPAALHVQLPDSGSVRVAGHRYQVRSFHEHALASEPVKIWILHKGRGA